jgi:hypothetical protein
MVNSVAANVEEVGHHLRNTSAELDVLMPTILDRAFRGEL